MSVQFGRWNWKGQAPSPDYIEKVRAVIAPYGPDSDDSYSQKGIDILYRAFHTTKESHREKQPHISASGAVIAWDGRLDNRADLISELRDSLTAISTDVAIVAAAYDKWNEGCFAKLIGDWALSIWNSNDYSLILAKDHIGTRHLYYSIDNNQATWSTILDPLVLFAGKTFAICEEYIAGCLSFFPAAHLTPYVGIHAVPPSSFVLLRPGKYTVRKYWDFDPANEIRYRSDAEYEEHFRAIFATAVQRRLRSDRPVLAELSGGMDSSSIVCMADTIIARGAAETLRLDTISWYDDFNCELDERPYFTKVEERRGRAGCHIDLASLKEDDLQEPFGSDFSTDRFVATPIRKSGFSQFLKEYAAYMESQGHRVVLPGVGGDDITGGGVLTPTPELQNLLARARFFALARQLNAWAAKMRKPPLLLLWDAVREFFLPLSPLGTPKDMHSASWLLPSFVHRNHAALSGYPSRMKLLGPMPSFQDNIRTLDLARRPLAYICLRPEMLFERRYPYLDRGLLEFMFAIPREQIVRIGQRRSLMKRALVGIVPDEVLNKRRKASATEQPKDSKKVAFTEWPSLAEIGQHMVASSTGIVDQSLFCEALQKALRNQEVPLDSLKRTLHLESWLRHVSKHELLTGLMPTSIQGQSFISWGKGSPNAHPTHKLS